jgi:hypothetical protein
MLKDKQKRLEYGKRHYRTNAAQYKARARAWTDQNRIRLRVAIAQYLSAHPCVDCGESDPIVLDFDHRDPADKDFEIKGFGRCCSVSTVLAEIEKCDVRCANCHRRRTFRERHWEPTGRPRRESPLFDLLGD